MILKSDAREIPLPDGCFHSIVTSPPYFGLRKYGNSELEIGSGSVQDYLEDMEKCAKEWNRLLDDEGLLWLNLGDTASGSGGAGGDYNKGGAKNPWLSDKILPLKLTPLESNDLVEFMRACTGSFPFVTGARLPQ